MAKTRANSFLLLGLLLIMGQAQASPYDDCLLQQLQAGADTLTVGEIRNLCHQQEAELQHDAAADDGQEPAIPTTYVDTFSVSPHKQNYILLFSHNTAPNSTPYGDDPDTKLDHDEIVFQVSLKFPIGSFAVGDKRAYLMAAYTAQSFWQAYNKTLSSPFRETNHEPEVFAVYPLDSTLPGVKRIYLMAGFSHQSNGRSQPLSRSWNRLYLDMVFEGENFKISLKPWYRIPEKDKEYPGASEGDDNPDISDYMGYGELSGAFQLGDNTLSFMVRNNLDYHNNKGALKMGWSFKLPFIEADRVKGYLSYFNGYGESLIDYDASVQRFGIGLMLADWL